MTKEFRTPTEVATLLLVSPVTVRQWAQKGILEARTTAGGLGSYGAHLLGADEIGSVAAEIRALTLQPFAMNLWVSNRDEGALFRQR